MTTYNKQAHATYYTRYHIIWIPRFRRKILVAGVASYLTIKLQETTHYYPDLYFLEINAQPDHLHLLMSIPPKYSISKVVNILKSNTSHALWNKFPFLKRVYWDDGSVWATGYFVSTVGVSEATIRNYIKYQTREEAGQAKLEL